MLFDHTMIMYLSQVVRWEDESKDYIQKQEPVSEDPEKLKEQIANLGEFKEAVDGKLFQNNVF